METAQDMNTQLRGLIGERVRTAIGMVKVRKDGDGVEVNVHRILPDGNLNTTFSVGSNGRVINSQTVMSAFTEENGEVSFGALSVGYYEPVVSAAIHSLREVLNAVAEARKG